MCPCVTLCKVLQCYQFWLNWTSINVKGILDETALFDPNLWCDRCVICLHRSQSKYINIVSFPLKKNVYFSDLQAKRKRCSTLYLILIINCKIKCMRILIQLPNCWLVLDCSSVFLKGFITINENKNVLELQKCS